MHTRLSYDVFSLPYFMNLCNLSLLITQKVKSEASKINAFFKTIFSSSLICGFSLPGPYQKAFTNLPPSVLPLVPPPLTASWPSLWRPAVDDQDGRAIAGSCKQVHQYGSSLLNGVSSMFGIFFQNTAEWEEKTPRQPTQVGRPNSWQLKC